MRNDHSSQAARTLLPCALAAALVAGPVFACNYPVRDAALTEWQRDIAVMLFFIDKDDATAKTWRQTLQKACETYLADANIGFQEVDVSAQGFDLKMFGMKEKPAKYPCVAVRVPSAAEEGSAEIFRLDGTLDENKLRGLVDSPKRKALREELIKKASVAILMPGKDEEKNAAARKLIQATKAQFEKSNGKPVGTLEIGRAERDKEEWGLWSQVRPQDGDQAGVAVVFGRGKIVFGATLAGDKLNEDNLWELLGVPLGPCLCTVAPQMLGNDLLMAWPRDLDERIVRMGSDEGKDPAMGEEGEEPAAHGEMVAAVSKTGESVAAKPADPAKTAAPAEVEKALAKELGLQEAPSLESSSRGVVLGVLGLAGVLTVAFGAVVWLKKKREAV